MPVKGRILPPWVELSICSLRSNIIPHLKREDENVSNAKRQLCHMSRKSALDIFRFFDFNFHKLFAKRD